MPWIIIILICVCGCSGVEFREDTAVEQPSVVLASGGQTASSTGGQRALLNSSAIPTGGSKQFGSTVSTGGEESRTTGGNGSSETGGQSPFATGGSAALEMGGADATGGNAATGGADATGGNAGTGGSAATGGSSAVACTPERATNWCCGSAIAPNLSVCGTSNDATRAGLWSVLTITANVPSFADHQNSCASWSYGFVWYHC